MILYEKTLLARFIERPNRFIATCALEDDTVVTVHVKNTGRCKELLLEHVSVLLNHVPSATRKTDYDLVAVKKGNQWINIDSQIPNRMIYEGLENKAISFIDDKDEISLLSKEKTFLNSRFDVYFETKNGQKSFVEIKGMTLTNLGVAAFPDAPSVRALKHVNELIRLQKEGYQNYIVFVVQMDFPNVATINKDMQPALFEAFTQAIAQGVKVLAFRSVVTTSGICIKDEIPFSLETNFESPNK